MATPPGAQRQPSAPDGATDLGNTEPPESPADPDLVQRTGWWSTAQSPTALLAWLSANPPVGTVADGTSSAILGGHTSLWVRDFQAPAEAGVISRQLVEAAVSPLPDGGSALREDVIVTYLPAKPDAETIPNAATITVAPVFPAGQGAGGSAAAPAAPAAPVTVTSPMEIAEITSLVNGLPVRGPGNVNCPMDDGAGLRLTFRAGSGAQLATANVAASGCRTVSVAVGGDTQPELSGGDGFTDQIMTVIGASWELTTR